MESRGSVLGRAAAMVVRAYQFTIGKVLPPRCRFTPSCSEYAVQALRRNGLVIGLAQAVWRLMRCGPWTSGGSDPVKPITGLTHRFGKVRTHG